LQRLPPQAQNATNLASPNSDSQFRCAPNPNPSAQLPSKTASYGLAHVSHRKRFLSRAFAGTIRFRYAEYVRTILRTNDRREFDLDSMEFIADLGDDHSWFFDNWLDQDAQRSTWNRGIDSR
jgi:hypothetical protein